MFPRAVYYSEHNTYFRWSGWQTEIQKEGSHTLWKSPHITTPIYKVQYFQALSSVLLIVVTWYVKFLKWNNLDWKQWIIEKENKFSLESNFDDNVRPDIISIDKVRAPIPTYSNISHYDNMTCQPIWHPMTYYGSCHVSDCFHFPVRSLPWSSGQVFTAPGLSKLNNS